MHGRLGVTVENGQEYTVTPGRPPALGWPPPAAQGTLTDGALSSVAVVWCCY